MNGLSNYDKLPVVEVPSLPDSAWQGWQAIVERLRGEVSGGARLLAVECYPGVFVDEIERVLADALHPSLLLRVDDCYHAPGDVDRMVAHDLTADRVFGRMNGFTIEDFVDPARLESQRARLRETPGRLTIIVGTGTELIAPDPDVLIYADLPRWEIQHVSAPTKSATWRRRTRTRARP